MTRIIPLVLVVLLAPPPVVLGQELGRYQELDQRPLDTLSNAELSELLDLRAAFKWGQIDFPEEVGRWALKATDQPFKLGASRFKLAEGDCVTLAERSIALALSRDWQTYYNLSQRLRHKEGRIDFLERNFFTLTQWVPNNAWLLDDVTDEFGPTDTYIHVTRPKEFYARLEFGLDETEKGQAKRAARNQKVASVPEKTEHMEHYVHRERIEDASPLLRTGDILLVIRRFEKPGLKPWLATDHMMVVVREGSDWDDVYVVHSSKPRARKEAAREFPEYFHVRRGCQSDPGP